MRNIQVGKEVKIKHSRKGSFSIRVEKIRGSLISGVITKGTARYMAQPDREPGDMIDIDTSKSFIEIIPD